MFRNLKKEQVLFLIPMLGCGVIGPATGPLTGGGTDGFSDYIIENTEYFNAAAGCSSSQLNNVTSAFDNVIKSKFLGSRLHDGSSECLTGGSNCPFPSYIVDNQLSLSFVDGTDQFRADGASLFVYAGHGGIDPIAGPHTHFTAIDPGNPTTPSTCRPRFDNHIRLGKQAGAKARIAIWAASCIGAGNWNSQSNAFWDTLGQSNTLQHLAFFDSPDIGDAELGKFANAVKNGAHNYAAWLAELSYSDNGFYNQPVVFTLKATNESDDDFYDRIENSSFWTMEHLPEPPAGVDDWIVDDYSVLGLGPNEDPEVSTCQY